MVQPWNRRLRTALVAGSLILIAGVVLWCCDRNVTETPPVRVAQLTVLPGHELWPTFSPDGDQLAFEWGGENSDNSDIYITMVGSSEVDGSPATPRATGHRVGRLMAGDRIRQIPGSAGRPDPSRVTTRRIGYEAERHSCFGAACVVP